MKETSFGIIPLKQVDHAWHVLLIQHRAGHYWSFPKGRGEKNEEPLESAKRELKEETGLVVKELLIDEPIVEHYRFVRNENEIDKTVFYFLALVDGLLQLQEEEILTAEWVELNKAEELITFDQAKAVCKKVIEILEKN